MLGNSLAIAFRPLPGCVFHSDRGSQYRALAFHDLVGSMRPAGLRFGARLAGASCRTGQSRAAVSLP